MMHGQTKIKYNLVCSGRQPGDDPMGSKHVAE